AAGKADLAKAVAMAPDLFEARMQRAVAIAYEDPQEAAVHLQFLRHRYPDERQVRFTLGAVQRMLGNTGEAAKLFDELLEANPNDVSTLVERAYVAINTPRTEPAERQLEYEEAERLLRRAFTL